MNLHVELLVLGFQTAVSRTLDMPSLSDLDPSLNRLQAIELVLCPAIFTKVKMVRAFTHGRELAVNQHGFRKTPEAIFFGSQDVPAILLSAHQRFDGCAATLTSHRARRAPRARPLMTVTTLRFLRLLLDPCRRLI
jgi:hypothetical protein